MFIPKKFVKKPVIVEAYQVSEEVKIETLEGRMTASPGDWIVKGVHGDWIVKGVHGEKYPVKPEIFEKTYQPIE